ncbi:translation initiation factor IF-2 [Bellilinea caldifistulae]|uniref:Translation initiation factor IF-2 n=1 Tax=Bellilinea caldifistulae TaxID=360411 RepID=A0A0P6X2X9_9CHLR|nr:translation initiation factor IF-2 [Bellilinea caldifistulae]KPL77110.1 translation initiation factor IF-2 [Bellilinea caldifistulae]GAP10057.1 translation initiation factor IF-2 [Bellilinea caldifistulae]
MSDNGSKTIELPASITVRDLAQRMQASPIQVIKILMSNGVMANINQQIDFDTAAVVASELGYEAQPEVYEEVEEKEVGEIPLWRQLIAKEKPEALQDRPPVVTILGHVDHGKTTLLDAIRDTNVAGGEAGGITQHIGAYQVEHKNRLITFLDTPGHAAFTAMRSRGAQGADIVVLVVAANDGVMPQTREAIAHARAARVPIIVAMNKIDRPDANPDFTKKQLAEVGLVPDDWDGDTMVVPVSAKLRKGIDDLLEAILLVADTLDIKANPEGRVFGTVIEAKVDRAKGVVATLLVYNGTLETGDIVVAGKAYGRIRAMFDFRGRKLRKAGPSTPVQIMGLNDVPDAGELFLVYENEREARTVVEERLQQQQKRLASAPKISLEELFNKVQSGEDHELRLIIKADVQGSLEPIISSLNELGKGGEIRINILHAETGNISENDVMLAAASNAIVVGFNVQADAAARRLAESEGVSIRLYDIIYRLTEDIEKAMKGLLEPEVKEVIIGHGKVLATFRISKVGVVAGCRVLSGEFRRNAKVRLRREGTIIYEGEFASLKHEKEDVREVRAGFECGAAFKNFNDIAVGDEIECYIFEKGS